MPPAAHPALAQVRRYYDRHTTRFISLGQGGDHGAIHRAVWGPGVVTRADAFHYVEDRILDALDTLITPDRVPHVVDLGCGVGGSLCHLARRRHLHGTGVTLSPVQARLAADRIAAAGLEARLRVIEGDYTDPALPLAPADVAYAIESFVHGPDPAAFFDRCATLIRPGGYLIVCDDTARPVAGRAARRIVGRFRRGWHVHTLLDRASMGALATGAGFDHRATDDLTPYLELGRPRDRALALLTALVGWLPPVDAALGHLTGGSALQTCLRRGWIGYDLARFQRRPEPVTDA